MPDEGPRCALYYPHTGIRTVELLKCGLLLWDTVEYISPGPSVGARPPADVLPADRKLVAEAMELLLVQHVPSREERERTHETIELLVKSDLAEKLRQVPHVNSRYLVYSRKFSRKTWELLENSELAKVDIADPDRDWVMSPALGLVLMSVLADACAGTLKRTVTDQHAAYETVRESVLKNVVPLDAGARTMPSLVDVTLRVADLRPIPLKDLVEIRKREKKEGAASSLTDLRRSLASTIDKAAQEIGKAQRETDKKTLRQNFEDDMTRDLAKLQKDLGGLAWNVLFSREFAAGVFIGLGLLTVPGGQAAAGAAALAGTALAYRRQRLEAYADHPMAWLYMQT